jgi:elongation factor Ts
VELDQTVRENEMAIYREQALQEGKPEKVIEKIVEGRVDKYYGEVCLLEQSFVKDPDHTVQDMLNELVAKCGENVTIRRFERFVLGDES